MKNLTTYWTSEEFKLLVDDCKSTLTEAFFSSNWVLIEGYHTVGQRLREEKEVPITDLVKNLAVRTNISERKLWYAVKLYDKFPDTSKLPEGKTITMNKIITKYLPGASSPAKPECQHQFTIVKQCLKCKAILPIDKPDTS